MNYRNILPLVSHTQAFSTDYWDDFGYWNDGTFWYEKTPTYTARVTAYAIATGITDYTILDPLNIFDLGLTYYGLDTIMKALYPMVTDKTSQSDMANQMKYNFMNPLDTNPAFRLNWVGGWVYSRTGALPNGTNAYADTFLNSFSNINNAGHLSYYSRTQTISTTQNDIGNINNSVFPAESCFIASTATIDVGYHGSTSFNTQQNISDKRGFVISSKLSSTSLKLYKNGFLQNTVTTSNTINTPSLNIYLGARNNINTADTFSTKQCAFSSIGGGLTDFQADIFSTLVNNLQKALNRAVY